MAEPITPPPATEAEIQKAHDTWLAKFFNDKSDVPASDTPPAADNPPPPVDPPPVDEKTPKGDAEPKSDEGDGDGLTPAPEGDAAPVSPPAAAAAAEPAPVIPPAIDEDALADKVADRIAAKQPAPPAPAAAPSVISERDQKTLKALEHLETMNPQRKGIAARARDFYTREAAYRENWLRNNPDKPFDPGAEDHEEFYSKWEPQIDKDELDDARLDLRAREIVSKEVDQKVSERVAPIEEKARQAERVATEQEYRPQMEQLASMAVSELVTAAVPEFKELLPGGRLTTAAITAMKEKDPEAFDLLNREAALLKVKVRECDAMILMPEHFRLNESLVVKTSAGAVRPHAEILSVAQDLEDHYATLPPDKQMKDKRRFVPQSVMQKAIDQCKGDERKIKTLWDRYFIIGPEDVRAEFVRRHVETVKQTLEFGNKRAQRVAGKSAPSAASGVASNGQNNPPKPSPTPPPSVSSASDNVDIRLPGAPPDAKPEQIIASRMFS